MIATVHAAHPEVSIRRLCELFGVGRTWYYTQPSPEETTSRAVAVRAAIEEIVLTFPGYGYRRVTKQLQRDGWTINHKRVLRVMREESLRCQLKRRFVTTTDSSHGLRRYPNLIAEMVVERPDQVWQADITSIRLPTGFAYLACILDAGAPSGSAPLCRLGAVAHDRQRPDGGRVGDGALDAPTGAGSDPPFGSRGPVRQRGQRRAPRASERPDQHGRDRQSV